MLSLVPTIHLLKQHTQVAITDEPNFYDQSVARTKQAEQATPLLPSTGISPNSSSTLSKENKMK